MKDSTFPIVILRPGTIYGPGGDLYTPMMGFSLMNKLFVVIGNGKFELPLVYVDNLADAIIRAIQSGKADHQIFNVVDSERIDKKEYMNKLIKALYPMSSALYFPYSLLHMVTGFQEMLCRAIKRGPFLTRYRLTSSQRSIRYDNTKIVQTLRWEPRVSKEEAFCNIINYERNADC